MSLKHFVKIQRIVNVGTMKTKRNDTQINQTTH